MRRDRVDPDRLHTFLRDVGTRLPNGELRPVQEYYETAKSL